MRDHNCVALSASRVCNSHRKNLASSRCTALHAAPIRACVSRPSLLRRQRSAIALLEEIAFLNSVEAIFPANIGSWAMALTCHLQGNIPDIAPTAVNKRPRLTLTTR
jgi:hypothetical protein